MKDYNGKVSNDVRSVEVVGGVHGNRVWSAFVLGMEGALRVFEQVEFIQTTLVINPSVIHIP